MRTSELTVRTVAYVLRRFQTEDPRPAVVLSTVAHVEREADRVLDRSTQTIQPDPDGRGWGRTGVGWPAARRGLPVLTLVRPIGRTLPITDSMPGALLAAAAELPRLTGPVPSVPDEMVIEVVRPQDLRDTWAAFQTRREDAEADTAKRQARRQAIAAANRHSRDDVYRLLEAFGLDHSELLTEDCGPFGDVRVAPLEWPDLHALLLALVDAVRAEQRAERVEVAR